MWGLGEKKVPLMGKRIKFFGKCAGKPFLEKDSPHISLLYFVPVEPKPPVPLTVSESSSVSS